MGDINLKAALGGQITLTPTNTAANYTVTFPAVTGVVAVQASASYTAGSVLFANSSGQIAQNNANFFWDNTNNRLGIGTSTPTAALSVFSASASPTSVANGVRFLESTNGYGLNLGGSSTGYSWIQGVYGGSSTLGYNNIVIQPNGSNVGIGNTSPVTTLDVTGIATIRNNSAAFNTTPNTNYGLNFQASSSGDCYVTSYSSGGTTQLVFATNSGGAAAVERMRILSTGNILCLSGGSTSANGTGIAFPATQSASTDVNTLDDYEEGTWTPTITPLSGSLTSYVSSGTYTRIGNTISARFAFSITNAGTASSVAVVSNLPYPTTGGNTTAGVMRENAVVGIGGTLVPSSTTQIYGAKYDGGSPFVTNYTWACEITYQTS